MQAQRDPLLPMRMFVYHYRIFDWHEQRAASLVVLADDQRRWRPSAFSYTLWGCTASLRFPAVKLLDYQQRRAELEASGNPFAVVVMAHLEAQRTRRDGPGRLAAKLGLVRELHRHGLEEKEIRNLFRFIDWLMVLPEQLRQEFWTGVCALEEEKKMPYVTQTERMFIEKGLQQGREQGVREGREQGVREGLLEGVRLGLELRFGQEGLALVPEVQTLDDEALRRIQQALLRGSSLQEVRKTWQG